jgi:hypothetical protein
MIEKNDIAPAFMAEIIENVKSNMVMRDEQTIKALHFKVCIDSYLRQVQLSKTKDTSASKDSQFVNAFKAMLHDEGYFGQISNTVKAIANG